MKNLFKRANTFFVQLFILSVFSSILSSCGSKVSGAQAVTGSVRLAWNAPEVSPGVLDTTVTGYRIHWGTESGDYTNAVDVGFAETAKVENLPLTQVFFVATAYNAQGRESNYSNEVSTNVTLKNRTQVLEFNED